MPEDTVHALVLGATGATGRLLVGDLLERGHRVTAIVRSPASLPDPVREHERLTIVEGTVLGMPSDELAAHLRGVDAVASCLGHRLSLAGLFGPPYRLVRDSLRTVCEAIRAAGPEHAVRVVLMNSSGCRDLSVPERVSAGERVVLGLLRTLVPPHADNEAAAAYLRRNVDPDDPAIAWCILRPDALTDEAEATPFELHPSPTTSAIFSSRKTSRANTARCIADLFTSDDEWEAWRGRSPVVYNRARG